MFGPVCVYGRRKVRMVRVGRYEIRRDGFRRSDTMPQAARLVRTIAALIYFCGLDRGPQLYRCRLMQAARRRYVLNSLASGRRLALRIILLQLAVALLAGLVFLTLGAAKRCRRLQVRRWWRWVPR